MNRFVTDEERQLLHSLRRIDNELVRRLSIFSVIANILTREEFYPPIIVGGSAVALYSGGLYGTVDIDVVTQSDEALKHILLELGYKKDGKDYIHSEFDSFVEIPSRELNGDMGKIREYVVLETGFPIQIIGIEDIILDRIGSFDATGDQDSREWAIRLLTSFYDDVDYAYLHSQAHEKGFFKKYEKIQKTARTFVNQLKKYEMD